MSKIGLQPKNTTKYLAALEAKKNNGVENSHTRFIISESGLGTLNGTWIHEKLILSLARYISSENIDYQTLAIEAKGSAHF